MSKKKARIVITLNKDHLYYHKEYGICKILKQTNNTALIIQPINDVKEMCWWVYVKDLEIYASRDYRKEVIRILDENKHKLKSDFATQLEKAMEKPAAYDIIVGRRLKPLRRNMKDFCTIFEDYVKNFQDYVKINGFKKSKLKDMSKHKKLSIE